RPARHGYDSSAAVDVRLQPFLGTRIGTERVYDKNALSFWHFRQIEFNGQRVRSFSSPFVNWARMDIWPLLGGVITRIVSEVSRDLFGESLKVMIQAKLFAGFILRTDGPKRYRSTNCDR